MSRRWLTATVVIAGLAALVYVVFQTVILTTASSEPTFALSYNEDGFCPAAGGSDLTFRIDPYAGEPVMAVTADGRVRHVKWPSGFVAGSFDDPVVRDSAGTVVARDGERLTYRPGRNTDLHRYAVCFGGETIWVLNELAQ